MAIEWREALLPRRPLEIAVELLALGALIAAVTVSLVTFADLPERVPVHWGFFSDQPNRWSDKGTFPWFGVLAPLGTYLLCTVGTLRPSLVNLIYDCSLELKREAARWIKLLGTGALSWLQIEMVRAALGDGRFTPVYSIVVLTSCVLVLGWLALRARRESRGLAEAETS